MNQRTIFLIQVLDKIASPLMQAVQSTSASTSDQEEDPALQEAQRMAELLAKTVQASLDLSHSMDLKSGENDADSIRLALAAITGPLIAEDYKTHRKVPAEADLKRIGKALEAAVTFSETFAPAGEHGQRLKSFDTQDILLDGNQSQILYMSAMVPTIDAIAEFSFGQPETKLIQDVVDKLVKRSEALRQALFSDVSDAGEMKYLDLRILKTLSEIYTGAHRAQMQKIMGSDGDSRPDQISIDPVWTDFDIRLSMIETLLNITVPGGQKNNAQGGVAPSIQADPPANPENPAPAPPPAAEQPADSGGPMGFFAKKDTAEPASAPPAPVQQQPAAPTAPPPAAPPQAPAAPEDAQPAPAEASGNPMGFFKPGTKKTEDQ